MKKLLFVLVTCVLFITGCIFLPPIELSEYNCLFLDGKDDYGEIEYSSNLDFDDEITIEAKVYIARFEGEETSQWRGAEDNEPIFTIINQSHESSSIGDYTLAVTPTRGLFAFETVDSLFSVDFNFEIEKWYHIAIVHKLGDSSNTRFYVNGTAYQGVWGGDGGEQIDGNDLSVPNNQTSYWIGKEGNNPYGGSFCGYIDELRIWNDIRTETEISANKDDELAGSEDNLVSYWKFNSASINEAVDEVGGNYIILKNGASINVQ